MNYEQVIESLDDLKFLTGFIISYGKEYHFGLGETFSIKVYKTFLTEGYAISYCISGWGGEFDFEEFYDRMPQKMQENIIFNINTFQKINANQCSEEDRQNIIEWAEIINEETEKEISKYGLI